jgi:hypothetical protein
MRASIASAVLALCAIVAVHGAPAGPGNAALVERANEFRGALNTRHHKAKAAAVGAAAANATTTTTTAKAYVIPSEYNISKLIS